MNSFVLLWIVGNSQNSCNSVMDSSEICMLRSSKFLFKPVYSLWFRNFGISEFRKTKPTHERRSSRILPGAHGSNRKAECPFFATVHFSDCPLFCLSGCAPSVKKSTSLFESQMPDAQKPRGNAHCMTASEKWTPSTFLTRWSMRSH